MLCWWEIFQDADSCAQEVRVAAAKVTSRQRMKVSQQQRTYTISAWRESWKKECQSWKKRFLKATSLTGREWTFSTLLSYLQNWRRGREREITDHRFKDNNKWRTQSLLYVIRQIWWDFLDLSTRKKRWSTRTKRLTLQIVKICTTECLSHLLLSCIWIILDDESQEQDNEKKTFSSSSVRFSVLDVWRKDLKKQVPNCAQHIYLELSNNDDEEVAGLDNKE